MPKWHQQKLVIARRRFHRTRYGSTTKQAWSEIGLERCRAVLVSTTMNESSPSRRDYTTLYMVVLGVKSLCRIQITMHLNYDWSCSMVLEYGFPISLLSPYVHCSHAPCLACWHALHLFYKHLFLVTAQSSCVLENIGMSGPRIYSSCESYAMHMN